MLPPKTWVKSTASGPNSDNCVEVYADDRVAIRDTKDRSGPVLGFSVEAFRGFVSAAAAGQFAAA